MARRGSRPGAAGALDALPAYQLARLMAEFFASVDEHLGTMFPGRLAEANIFLVIARTSLPDWLDGDRLAPPDATARAIRVHAIATSLARSPETLGRHVRWLIAHGYLVGGPAGVALTPTAANAARTIGLYAKLHDLFLRFAADLAATTDHRPAPGRGGTPGVAAVLSRAMEVVLATLEPDALVPADPVSESMLCAVHALNVRHVTHDPILARAFGDRSVPDDERRAVSLSAVARLLGVPYATIWRKARKLEAYGLLQRRQRRWIAPSNALQAAAVEGAFQRAGEVFLRKLGELERLGFDRAAIPAAYLCGRPAAASDGREAPPPPAG